MVAGETGSGKTEFVKYLASHTKTSEKIITIEDTLELHLDKIFPQRDIVAMKTNNVASYSDVLVTCMRQNPKWILLSEVRSAEAVSAVRNSISSGHNILSTIHADKASAIPYRLYSLMETDLDVNQFLSTIYRYIQLGVHIKAYYSKERGKFHRELDEVCEFYVDDNNVPQSRVIYQKIFGREPVMRKPSAHLLQYLENQNIDVQAIVEKLPDEMPITQQADFSAGDTTEETTPGLEAPGANIPAAPVPEGEQTTTPQPEGQPLPQETEVAKQEVAQETQQVLQQPVPQQQAVQLPQVQPEPQPVQNQVLTPAPTEQVVQQVATPTVQPQAAPPTEVVPTTPQAPTEVVPTTPQAPTAIAPVIPTVPAVPASLPA